MTNIPVDMSDYFHNVLSVAALCLIFIVGSMELIRKAINSTHIKYEDRESTESSEEQLPRLYLKVNSDDKEVISYYEKACKSSHNRTAFSDSGFDLIIEKDIEFDITEPKTMILPTGISCAPDFEGGYDLVPRSSIYKTPFRLANSIGIIDNGYRGPIGAVMDFRPELVKKDDPNIENGKYCLKKGTRLVQLVDGTRLPIIATITDNLSLTDRGSGGFGSTGITGVAKHD